MKHTLADLFNTLFTPGEKVNIRVIKDDKENRKGTTRNHTSVAPSVMLCDNYPDSFPCVGINPRLTVRKLAAVKNMVIDIDGAELPEWAKECADIICTRDETHHHLYFCFAETTRENYKQYSTAIIRVLGGSDAQVSDPERVMRLPYFTHRKDGVKENEGYKIVFIRKNIERLPIEQKFEWVSVPAEKGKKESAPAIAQDYNSVIAFIKSVYIKKPPLTVGNGRSRELLFIGFDCHRWGITEESALALAQEISNERHNPPESIAVITHQIESAYKYARCEFGAALIAGSESEAAQRKVKHQFDITQRVRDKLAGWTYIHGACRLADSKTDRAFTSKEQIEDYISREIGEPVNFRRLLSDNAIETCDKVEYAPHREEKIFDVNGESYFNSFRPNTSEVKRDPKLKKSAVKIFCDHIDFIATTDTERVALKNYFAFCVQHVGQKVDWTPLIISKREGLGKSAFSVLFRKIFGEHNCSTVSAQRLLSGWTDFIAEKLFVTSHEVETSDTAALTELKSLITEERVRVNAKYARTYETNNCANFLLLSNKLSALRLERGNSRRFLVIYNDAAPKEKEYYAALFNAIENGAGWIYDYLLSVDLSAFDAHGAAPETEGLAMITEVTKPDSLKWLESQYEQCIGAFATPIVDMVSIERDAAQLAPPNVARYINSRIIATFLYHVGYTRREYRINGMKKHSWFNGDDLAFEKELKLIRDKLAPKKSTAI
jgi:hypothetical protein